MRSPSRRHSEWSSVGPSAELQDMLQQLGVLSQQHDELVQRVNELEVSKLSTSILDHCEVQLEQSVVCVCVCVFQDMNVMTCEIDI